MLSFGLLLPLMFCFLPKLPFNSKAISLIIKITNSISGDIATSSLANQTCTNQPRFPLFWMSIEYFVIWNNRFCTKRSCHAKSLLARNTERPITLIHFKEKGKFFIHLSINKHHLVTTPGYVSLVTMKAAASQQIETQWYISHHQNTPYVLDSARLWNNTNNSN